MIPEERRYLPKPMRYYAFPLICIGIVFNVGLKFWSTYCIENYVDTRPEIVTTRDKDKKGLPEGVHQYPSLVEQYEYNRSLTSVRRQEGLV